MDLYHTVGYFTGLFFIKPDMEPAALFRTAALIHLLDAILCAVIASHSGRRRLLWTIGGLVLGIWALGTLFFLPEKHKRN